MQIYSINNSQKTQPNFGYWQRDVIKPLNGIVNRNDTCFFRNGNEIPRLIDFICTELNHAPKINLYCFGCSDGSEPITMAMYLLTTKCADTIKKILPINAIDIDRVAFEKFKNNDYEMTENERNSIEYYTNNQLKRFFNEPYGKANRYKNAKVYVKPELYDNIDYNIGDILKDYKKIKPQNSVVIARNFWPYINNLTTRCTLFKNLYKHLDYGSYFVIGDFDIKGIAFHNGNIKNEIIMAGFKRTNHENVYIKQKN